MFLLTPPEMRRLDDESIHRYGIPSRRLMENAGREAYRIIRRSEKLNPKETMVVFCGPGNNGGDGWVLARHLIRNRIPCFVFMLGSESDVKGDGLAMLRRYEKVGGRFAFVPDLRSLRRSYRELKRTGLIIDALFGTGLSRPLGGFFKSAVAWLNSLPGKRISLDIPSGLDGSTGKPRGVAVIADRTITFGFPKVGFFLDEAARHVGRLNVVDIGLSPKAVLALKPKAHLITKRDIAACLAPRRASSHKGSYGHVFVVGGSSGKIGAGVMAAHAALKMGAGLSTLLLPSSCYRRIDPRALEIMYEPIDDRERGVFSDHALPDALSILKGASSVVLGPGLGTAPGTARFVGGLIEKLRAPLVLDADALNIVAARKSLLQKRKAPTLLTPHPGEMARLAGKSISFVQKNRLSLARNFAVQYGVHLLLKGHRGLLAFPDGQVWVNPTGNPGMASAGMGDVLSGFFGASLSQWGARKEAFLLPPFFHGLVGDLLAGKGHRVVTAMDLAGNASLGYRFLRRKTPVLTTEFY